MQNKLSCDWGHGCQDMKCLFCRSFILRFMLFCACMYCLLCELWSGKTPCDYAQQYPLPLPRWNSGNNPLKGMTRDSSRRKARKQSQRLLHFFYNTISFPVIFSILGFHSIGEKPASTTPSVSLHRFFCSFTKCIFCLTLSAEYKVTLIQQCAWSPLLTETRVYYLVQNVNSRLWDFFFFFNAKLF